MFSIDTSVSTHFFQTIDSPYVITYKVAYSFVEFAELAYLNSRNDRKHQYIGRVPYDCSDYLKSNYKSLPGAIREQTHNYKATDELLDWILNRCEISPDTQVILPDGDKLLIEYQKPVERRLAGLRNIAAAAV